MSKNRRGLLRSPPTTLPSHAVVTDLIEFLRYMSEEMAWLGNRGPELEDIGEKSSQRRKLRLIARVEHRRQRGRVAATTPWPAGPVTRLGHSAVIGVRRANDFVAAAGRRLAFSFRCAVGILATTHHGRIQAASTAAVPPSSFLFNMRWAAPQPHTSGYAVFDL